MAGKSWAKRAADAWSYGIECPAWVPFVLGGGFVIFGLAFLTGMSDAGDRSEGVIARSRPTTGVVLEFTDKAARDLREARVSYQIDGRERRSTVVIPDPAVNQGDTVTLRYDPARPGVVFAEGDRQPPGGEIDAWVGIAFAGTAICGLGAVLSAIPRKAPRPIGE